MELEPTKKEFVPGYLRDILQSTAGDWRGIPGEIVCLPGVDYVIVQPSREYLENPQNFYFHVESKSWRRKPVDVVSNESVEKEESVPAPDSVCNGVHDRHEIEAGVNGQPSGGRHETTNDDAVDRQAQLIDDRHQGRENVRHRQSHTNNSDAFKKEKSMGYKSSAHVHGHSDHRGQSQVDQLPAAAPNPELSSTPDVGQPTASYKDMSNVQPHLSLRKRSLRGKAKIKEGKGATNPEPNFDDFELDPETGELIKTK